MTDAQKLDYMRIMLGETDSCRVLTDEQLSAFLLMANGDVDGAIYRGALQKAEVSNVSLPDGTTLPNNREYWLALAAAHRPNKGGVIKRADGR